MTKQEKKQWILDSMPEPGHVHEFNGMETCRIYRVSRSNSDAVKAGDLVTIDKDGRLWKGMSDDGSQSGWIDPEDLTPEIMDFEVESH